MNGIIITVIVIIIFPTSNKSQALPILSHLPGDGLPSTGSLTCGVVADTVEIGRAGSNHQLPCGALGPAGANEVHGCVALQSWGQRQLVRQSNIPSAVSHPLPTGPHSQAIWGQNRSNDPSAEMSSFSEEETPGKGI